MLDPDPDRFGSEMKFHLLSELFLFTIFGLVATLCKIISDPKQDLNLDPDPELVPKLSLR